MHLADMETKVLTQGRVGAKRQRRKMRMTENTATTMNATMNTASAAGTAAAATTGAAAAATASAAITGVAATASATAPQAPRTVAGQAPRAVAGQAKREVVAARTTQGLQTQDLILIAVLLAAGAVLKLTVGSFFASFGMKPNFIIAMYCLAIILTRPSVGQSAVIGLLAGLVCQLPMLNATPGLNIVSELLGAVVCGLLVRIPMNIGGKADVNPFVNTFVSTFVSGASFALMAIYINVISNPNSETTVAAALVAYVLIVLGTATFNAILNQVLVPLMRKVLKR